MQIVHAQTDHWWTGLGSILARHLFSVVSLVIGAVILLLVYFGECRDALFLASVITLNIGLGIFQEIRAKLQLDKLKALTVRTVKLKTVNSQANDQYTEVAVDQLKVGQEFKVALGDQIPADAIISQSEGFEVNEAFLTGESDSLLKSTGQAIYAGSFVVAGQAVARISAVDGQTRISQMTSAVKRYSWHSTPIQKALTGLITTLTYVLLVVVLVMTIRQQVNNGGQVDLIKQIAAITATILPEGLVLAATVLFAYGAVQMYRRRVIIQHINSIESLARIQWLLVDKTGTLTENKLKLDSTLVAPGFRKSDLNVNFGHYLQVSDATGELASAYFSTNRRPSNISATTVKSFSSERRYGAIIANQSLIVVGAPDKLSSYLNKSQKKWLQVNNDYLAAAGKRVVAVLIGPPNKHPQKLPKKLSLIGLVSFAQPIKPTTQKTLDFFRSRAVDIRIVSGDQPQTVRAIGQELGLVDEEATVITGKQINGVSSRELANLIKQHKLFARISPQQKAELVKAAKRLGYVGMIGDGANDALAIKRADIGISMFKAADITRAVADIVLLDDEFKDLPKGVALADMIITNLELIGCLFLNKVIVGLTLIGCALIAQTSYPMSPRNITVLNYFIIGMPILMWTLYPRDRQRTAYEPSYLTRILPFVLASGLITSLVTIAAFSLSLKYHLVVSMTVFVTTLLLGIAMLIVAPRALGIVTDKHYLRRVGQASAASFVALVIFYSVVPLRNFFGLSEIRLDWLLTAIILAAIGLIIEYFSLRHKLVSRLGQWMAGGR